MKKEDVQTVRAVAETGELITALDILGRFPLPANIKNMVSLLNYRVKASNKQYLRGLIDEKENLERGSQNALQLFEVLTDLTGERMGLFMTKMVESGFTINEDLAKDKEFIHAFSQTLNKVLETNRTEKIEYFSNLLKNSFKGDDQVNIDEYEFNLKALDGLNFIEIQLLVFLFEFELTHEGEIDTERDRLKKNSHRWSEFLSIVEKEMNMEREECEAYLYGIEKSGMINFQKQRMNDTKHYGACTTILFWKLYDKIANESTLVDKEDN